MNIRHGDCALIGIDKLPEGLRASKGNVLMKGSGGNSHAFSGGKFYPMVTGNFTVGYLVADEGAKLYHPEHGCRAKGSKLKEMPIKAGIYEVKKQIEQTHEGMRPVAD